MISGGQPFASVIATKVGDRIETVLIEQEGAHRVFTETTTLARVFDEDANRCLILSTDEREEQTRYVSFGLKQPTG